PINREDFRFPIHGEGNESPRINVIRVFDNRIDTERCIEPTATYNHELISDTSRDLAKLMVIERHQASGHIGRGFVRGFGLRSGALASSVAHDSHNLIVVGTDDPDMLI